MANLKIPTFLKIPTKLGPLERIRQYSKGIAWKLAPGDLAPDSMPLTLRPLALGPQTLDPLAL